MKIEVTREDLLDLPNFERNYNNLVSSINNEIQDFITNFFNERLAESENESKPLKNNSTDSKLLLGLGRFYEARNGEIVFVNEIDWNNKLCNCSGYNVTNTSDHILSWTMRGKYNVTGSLHDYDLIKEISQGEVIKHLEEKYVKPVKPAALTIEVGKFYKQADGRKAYVYTYSYDSFYYNTIGECGNLCCDINGICQGASKKYNLISEWSDNDE